MTLNELLPVIHQLNPTDKQKLFQLLDRELHPAPPHQPQNSNPKTFKTRASGSSPFLSDTSARSNPAKFPSSHGKKQSDEFPRQKEPPFWDIFPENPQIYQLVVEARSLKVLRMEENRSTKEKVKGGKHSLIYKREATIIQNVITR